MEIDSMTQTELASYLETLAKLVEATAKDAKNGGDPRLIILFVLLLPLMVIWETAKKS